MENINVAINIKVALNKSDVDKIELLKLTETKYSSAYLEDVLQPGKVWNKHRANCDRRWFLELTNQMHNFASLRLCAKHSTINSHLQTYNQHQQRF